jgi:penicillin-binding protein 2
MSEYVTNPDEAKEYYPRYRLLYITVAVTFVLFSSRLWYLQIITGNELREYSEKIVLSKIKSQLLVA